MEARARLAQDDSGVGEMATATRATRVVQKQIGREWREFRGRYLLSQERLAEAMGVSRRLVQIVESGKSNDPKWTAVPQMETRRKFEVLKARYESEAQ